MSSKCDSIAPRTILPGAIAMILLAAGTPSWANGECLPGECVNPAITTNGRFSVELLEVVESGSQFTFRYEVCQDVTAGA